MILSIREQIKELEQMIEDYPDKSYEQTVLDLKTRLDKLRADADHFSIPQGHEVRHLISGLSSAMANLTATQKKPPSSTSAHCSSDYSTSSKVNLPKLALLTFHGDPMKWASFWERFEAAVDSNDQLSVSHKLTHLREAVKDPKVSPLLYS